MQRLLEYMNNPRRQIMWWAIATGAWMILTPVTLLTGLAHSLPWLNFLSLFANTATCGTGLLAAWAVLHAKRVDEANLHAKLDHIIENHPDIPPLDEKD